jgi:hypothetical protein
LQPSESQLAVRAAMRLVARMRVWRPRIIERCFDDDTLRRPDSGRSRCSYSPVVATELRTRYLRRRRPDRRFGSAPTQLSCVCAVVDPPADPAAAAVPLWLG